MSLKNAIKMINIQKSYLVYISYIGPFCPLQSNLDIFGPFSPFCPLKFYSVQFGPFGLHWSYSVHVDPVLSTLVRWYAQDPAWFKGAGLWLEFTNTVRVLEICCHPTPPHPNPPWSICWVQPVKRSRRTQLSYRMYNSTISLKTGLIWIALFKWT